MINTIVHNAEPQTENEAFLTQQLITYLGNKRSLLGFIGQGIEQIRARLGKKKLTLFDVFSGSGSAARYFKQFAQLLVVNDLERYCAVINRCYLSNQNELNMPLLKETHAFLLQNLTTEYLREGFISELYAPKNDQAIQSGERVFYTQRNAQFIDTARTLIETVPKNIRHFFLAPLLAQASVHANTSGVFKGFYKNSLTGIGQFGGKKCDALTRIMGNITLPFPVFSNFACESRILTGNANTVIFDAPEVDAAYIDPPYNQHPYGSNYFMLNLILDYQRPQIISTVAGIPPDWNRSDYNKPNVAFTALQKLVSDIKAKFVLISFNSDGFIPLAEMKIMLEKLGKLTILETPYNTFRASRNLHGRTIHIKEYVYMLEK